jgi:hypothetical protein
MSKIGSTPNLPTTDPLWVDQRIMDGKELTAGEAKISKDQADTMKQTLDILHKPVQKGDYKGANAKAAELQRQFESLSPDMKKFMYNQLQSKTGGGVIDKEIAGQFRYYLSTGQRDKLLKTLNPDHQKDQIHKYTMNDAKAKAQKNIEMNMQGTTLQKLLELKLQIQEKESRKIINNLQS